MEKVEVEGDLKSLNNTWGTIEKMAKYRQKWRTFVAAQHVIGILGSKSVKFKVKDCLRSGRYVSNI